MSRQHRLLIVLLRIGGVATTSAFLAILLPPDWMASTHEWLGMGEFPRAPVVDYLARSIAALYGFHGVLLLVVARDVVRFAPVVTFIGVLGVLFGLIVTAIDLYAPLPLWWTLGEGPVIAIYGAVILFLKRSVPAA